MDSGETRKEKGSLPLTEGLEQKNEVDVDEANESRSEKDSKKCSTNKPSSDRISEEQEVKMSLKRKLVGEKSQLNPEKKTKTESDKKMDEDEVCEKDSVAESEPDDGDGDEIASLQNKGKGKGEKEEEQQKLEDEQAADMQSEGKDETEAHSCAEEKGLMAEKCISVTKSRSDADLDVSRKAAETTRIAPEGKPDSQDSVEDDAKDLSLNGTSKSTDKTLQDQDVDAVGARDHNLPVPKSVPNEGRSEDAKDTSKAEPEEAQSVKSDGSSDKENVNCEAPIDLSNIGTPDADVIMLSDEDEPLQDSKRTKEEPRKYLQRVKRLQAELRNEEAKLVLLKKLRQSQLAPQLQEHPPVGNSGTAPNAGQLKPSIPRQQGGPPPLVKGGQMPGRSSSMHLQQQQQQQQQQPHSRSAMQGQGRNLQGPPPLIGVPRSTTTTSSSNGHGLQNVGAVRGLMPGINQLTPSSHRNLQQPAQQQASTPPQPAVDTQTPAQRQAAAKLALRKQLEKTLLQIPPPKPPAPEMNFIPSLACPDFVLLLGLEEVVNHIVDLQLIACGQKSADEKFICNPFTCVQCSTDYTPVWKREKPGSKNVICEHCVTWNQKRALKQEHTNRLKSAFVKALQQEQEIERMQAHSLASPSPPMPSPTPPAPPLVTAPPQALAGTANSVAAVAAISLNSATYRASAEARQHQSFLQAQQMRAAQPLGIPGFSGRPPFPYGLPYPNIKQADLQRQYLLDMIPRAASGLPWKH